MEGYFASRGPSNKAKEVRWRANRMAEDYVNCCGKLMYNNVTVGPFGDNPAEGRFPMERPATVGMLRTVMRRPTVIEKWSPYQVAMFEGALHVYGKVCCWFWGLFGRGVFGGVSVSAPSPVRSGSALWCVIGEGFGLPAVAVAHVLVIWLLVLVLVLVGQVWVL